MIDGSTGSGRLPDKCSLCGSTLREWCHKGQRCVLRCTACGLLSVPEGVKLTAAGVSIYEDESNVFFAGGNENYYLDESNMWSCHAKLEWVKRHARPLGRLLDAGANFGHFLYAAKADFDAMGFDISPQAVRWSQEHFHVANHTASIYELPSELRGPYDTVTCWDVLEHLPDPWQGLRVLRQVLKGDGILFLSTPDAGSVLAKLMGRRWHYVDPEQHLHLFNRRNIGMVLSRAGFQVVSQRSFGHYYRLQYVFDRLAQLHATGLLHWCAQLGQAMPRLIRARRIYLRLGDVMGIAARPVA
ncbi:MAG: class I SAM-dependent methyltransferase [Planctomycetota bacterium]